MEKVRIGVWRRSKLAQRAISTLRSKDFEEYRDQRRADGISDATIRNDLAVIAAVFKHFDYGVANPTAKTVKTLAVSEKRSRRLSALEQKNGSMSFVVGTVIHDLLLPGAARRLDTFF